MPDRFRFPSPYGRDSHGPSRIVQTVSRGQYVTREFAFEDAQKIARFRNAEKRFLRTGNEELLDPFRGAGVTDVEGTYWAFETDENILYELHEMDAPQFHEVYEDPSDEGW